MVRGVPLEHAALPEDCMSGTTLRARIRELEAERERLLRFTASLSRRLAAASECLGLAAERHGFTAEAVERVFLMASGGETQ